MDDIQATLKMDGREYAVTDITETSMTILGLSITAEISRMGRLIPPNTQVRLMGNAGSVPHDSLPATRWDYEDLG